MAPTIWGVWSQTNPQGRILRAPRVREGGWDNVKFCPNVLTGIDWKLAYNWSLATQPLRKNIQLQVDKRAW